MVLSVILSQSAILFSPRLFSITLSPLFLCLFIFLSSFILLSFSHLISAPLSSLLCIFISFFLPLSLWRRLLPCPSFFLRLSFFLSVAASSSPAVINRCLVGCWSVRNGRSNGCSQLLQAFPGSPHRTALCGPGSQTCRQNIQNLNTVLNIQTALTCARFISLDRPTSEHT